LKTENDRQDAENASLRSDVEVLKLENADLRQEIEEIKQKIGL